MEKESEVGMSKSLISELNKLSGDIFEVIKHNKGSYVHRRGDCAKHIYRIDHGTIRICNINKDGKEFIVKDLTAGEWFGLIGCFGSGKRPNDAIATNDAIVSRIEFKNILELLNINPPLYLSCCNQLAYYAEHYYNLAESAVFESLYDRTLMMLRQLCLWQKTQEVKITQKELAGLLGVTKEAVGIQLNKLKSNGLVKLGYGCIEICDR
ncbi:Crp/Fnr family transcriptional regulator [Nitrincola sp.]|uniref:Crp/Fnr family transcriptional regulator n=1 Tax=Nitrincola sp. TaxID=1926584 RepID=UPI003A95DDBB